MTNSEPVFTDFVYRDVNETSRKLTGSDSIFISGYSRIEAVVSADNRAQAKNSAVMKNYTLQIGSQTSAVEYSSDADVSMVIDKVTSGNIAVSAYDSRGLSASVSRDAVLKEYKPVAITGIELVRENGVDVQTKLIMDVSLWDENFGAADNGIISCTYRYRKISKEDNAWTEGTTEISAEDFVYMEEKDAYHLEKQLLGDDENGFAFAGSYEVEVIATDLRK